MAAPRKYTDEVLAWLEAPEEAERTRVTDLEEPTRDPPPDDLSA